MRVIPLHYTCNNTPACQRHIPNVRSYKCRLLADQRHRFLWGRCRNRSPPTNTDVGLWLNTTDRPKSFGNRRHVGAADFYVALALVFEFTKIAFPKHNCAILEIRFLDKLNFRLIHFQIKHGHYSDQHPSFLYTIINIFNPIPDDKSLDWSKLKQIANDTLKCI